MLELGIKDLVMANAGVLAIAATGGFLLSLPKDAVLPSWTYRSISDVGKYALRGEHGFVTRRLQIDCYANPLNPGQVVTLAQAIDQVLSGYQGTLSDPDSTIVYGCFRSDLIDFFDDAGRTYRRMLEYEIQYCNA
jgi:hypothetical protein